MIVGRIIMNGIGDRAMPVGLDYFEARYMSSAQGRFASPDPGPWLLSNPQSYNAYTYALNNPLRYIDEDGLYGAAVRTRAA